MQPSGQQMGSKGKQHSSAENQKNRTKKLAITSDSLKEETSLRVSGLGQGTQWYSDRDVSVS